MTKTAKFTGALLVAIMTAPFWAGTHAAHADDAIERERLVRIERQLAHVERQLDETQGIVLSLPPGKSRYHFDYARMKTDLARVRAGVSAYLNPSRTQPRDPDALISDYTRENETP